MHNRDLCIHKCISITYIHVQKIRKRNNSCSHLTNSEVLNVFGKRQKCRRPTTQSLNWEDLWSSACTGHHLYKATEVTAWKIDR